MFTHYFQMIFHGITNKVLCFLSSITSSNAARQVGNIGRVTLVGLFDDEAVNCHSPLPQPRHHLLAEQFHGTQHLFPAHAAEVEVAAEVVYAVGLEFL